MFLFRLAGHLGKTLKELGEMELDEFREWWAYCRYVEPFGREWHQAGTLAAAAIAPYCTRGRVPKPEDFMPIETPPQTMAEIEAELAKLKRS